MKKLIWRLSVVVVSIGAAHAATITAELFGVTKHSQLSELTSWVYSAQPQKVKKRLPVNPELGEHGTVYLVPEEKPLGHDNESTNVAWDFTVNNNRVNTVAIDLQWMRRSNSDALTLDGEVAQRTMPLNAAAALNSDVFYRHYVTPFSRSYFDPFVYLGGEEKAKYLRFFDGQNIYVQSLARSNVDQNTEITGHVVTENKWTPYTRHKIAGEALASTVEDADIAPHLILVKGYQNPGYLSPGTDPNLQARTVSVVMDATLHADAIINKIVLNEPVLFVDLLTLNMNCRKQTAAEALDWALKHVATASDNPTVDGRYIIHASDYLARTRLCLDSASAKS